MLQLSFLKEYPSFHVEQDSRRERESELGASGKAGRPV